MDKVSQLAMTSNLGVFKEPRGFIRLLEFILAIFAFATTTSHSSSSSFTVKDCGTQGDVQVTIPFSYPFRLTSDSTFNMPNCNDTTSSTRHPAVDLNSSAEFYVFVGVMAFLYTIAAVILYVCFDEKYRKYDMIPIVDFIVTAVWTLLWLISSSAWADGLSHLKYYTNPEELWIAQVPECNHNPSCSVDTYGNFAGLNVSIIFGFLCCAVWGGNVWFLFKETKWHKQVLEQQQHPEVQQQVPEEAPPQQI